MKKTFAILGHPVGHSLSPRLHNAVFQALDLDDYEYVLCDTLPAALKERIEGLKAGKFAGFSVTIPHKQAVMELCDELTDRARKIGAVNTVWKVAEVSEVANVSKDFRIVGDNTDYVGFKKSLEEAGLQTMPNDHQPNELPIPISNNALVLGSGGAARAVVAVLEDMGFQVTVASRKKEEKFSGFSELSNAVMVVGYDELDPEDDWKMIVNTTPVGMKNTKSEKRNAKELDLILANPNWYKKERLYVDVIYTPRMTSFLKRAQEVGAKVVTGDRMFLWQAVEQVKIFTGMDEVPVEVMEEVLEGSL